MKKVLFPFIAFILPLSLFGQFAIDHFPSLEESADAFAEFWWQGSVEITYDSTYYRIWAKAQIGNLEILTPAETSIYKSIKSQSVHLIPDSLFREDFYKIRFYSQLGVTENLWTPLR